MRGKRYFVSQLVGPSPGPAAAAAKEETRVMVEQPGAEVQRSRAAPPKWGRSQPGARQ